MQGTGYRVQDTGYSNTGYRVLQYRVQGTGYTAQGTGVLEYWSTGVTGVQGILGYRGFFFGSDLAISSFGYSSTTSTRVGRIQYQ